MSKEVCYDIVMFGSAACVFTWWPKRLPCETMISFDSLRSSGFKIGQVLFLRHDNYNDLIGLYKRLWKLFEELNGRGLLDYIAIAIDPDDVRLYSRLHFHKWDDNSYHWDLAGDRLVKIMTMDVNFVIKARRHHQRHVKNIMGEKNV